MVAATPNWKEPILAEYDSKLSLLKQAAAGLRTNLDSYDELRKVVHTMKVRVKDRDSLSDKIDRKFTKDNLSAETLFSSVNDLIGIRLLHLHTEQFVEIDKYLKSWIMEWNYALIGKPFARTWDDESRAYFSSKDVACENSPSMYTSVHYVAKLNSASGFTFEIQVRTLMEEVWGEVDHSINYPKKSKSLCCQEQLKALARSTSASSRLVDSIFRSHQEHLAK